MDYEKAYKVALERAKQVHEYSSDLAEIKRMEDIFPELNKEFEDEKIRKSLIKLFDDMEWDDSILHDYDLDKVKTISWLERQSKQEKEIRGKEEKISPKQAQETEIGKLNDVNVRKEFKWDSENKIMTIYGVAYEEMKALDDFIYCLRSGLKCPKGERGEEGFTYQYPPSSIGHNEGVNTNGKSSPIVVNVEDISDNPAKGVEMARNEMKSEPQTIMFTDSGTMRIVDKLNEVIGKLGDIHEVLSKPFVFPYRDYTPPSPVPGMDVWYKTHGVEKVTPVTCETLNSIETDKIEEHLKEK